MDQNLILSSTQTLPTSQQSFTQCIGDWRRLVDFQIVVKANTVFDIADETTLPLLQDMAPPAHWLTRWIRCSLPETAAVPAGFSYAAGDTIAVEEIYRLAPDNYQLPWSNLYHHRRSVVWKSTPMVMTTYSPPKRSGSSLPPRTFKDV